MIVIPRNQAVYSMSPDHPPAARIASGEQVVFETSDCFGCQLTSEEQKVGAIDWERINPATGPLYVEGALPGDVLKVEILDISLADHATAVEMPGEGVYGHLPTKETTRIFPVKDGILAFNDRLTFPVEPMIGVIGVAPAEGSVLTGTPDSHGGNMDCNRICAGSTLYLPVNVPGALLAMGDLHAIMGDGEVCVCGAEISGAVTVRATVLKDCALPTPFLIREDLAAAIFSAKTMEEAARGATCRMRQFLLDFSSLPSADAGILLSLSGSLRICQAVDPMITCRMELPRRVIDALEVLLP